MPLSFGAVAALPNHAPTVDLYRYMDAAGFRALWIPDTPSLAREMSVCMTTAALHTERIQINGGVTNPLIRHPAVLASAISSVDEQSDGRAAVSISTGDSAVHNVGLKPAKMAQLEEFIQVLRSLWTNQTATYQDHTVRLLWPERPSPIYMAAEGPKTLRLAGRIADGVIIGMGLLPEVIEGALGYLQEGLEEAGRTLDDIDVWWLAKWNIAASKREAIEEIRMALSASGNHAFRFHMEGKFVPDELKEPIRELQARYVYSEHSKHGSKRRNAQLVDELGLTSYFAERFAITGTVDDFIAQCEALHGLGVRQLRLSVAGQQHDALLRLVGDHVLPAFAGQEGPL